MSQTRREFLKNTITTTAGIAFLSSNTSLLYSCSNGKLFNISLAEWSLHNALFGKEMDNLEFPEVALKEYGIKAVEYVSTFFKDTTEKYLGELLLRSKDNDVRNVLIMIDGEGNLGDVNEEERLKAVNNHHKWIDAAKYLGCHSIRVNARGEGTAEEVAKAAIEGLGKLTEYGEKDEINVIVENHGGYSSDGKWLSNVISQVNNKYCGTLPDFGNFCIEAERTEEGWNCVKEYDRYLGMEELMPYAKGVSAKSYDFDAEGNETQMDFHRIMKTIKNSGYKGYVGIEYEGKRLSEKEGILATKSLLERVFQEI